MTTKSDDMIASDLSNALFASLREAHPWLKLDVVKNVAERTRQLISDTLAEQEPIMTAAKSRTGFMHLSAELRNRIYELALICDETDSKCKDPRNQGYAEEEGLIAYYDHAGIRVQRGPVQMNMDGDGNNTYFGWDCDMRRQPALTLVSRQIRKESLPVYYGNNEFMAYCGDGFCVYGDEDDEDEEENGYHGTFINRTVRKFPRAIGKENAANIGQLTILLIDRDGESVTTKEQVMQDFELLQFGVKLEAVKVLYQEDPFGDVHFEALETEEGQDARLREEHGIQENDSGDQGGDENDDEHDDDADSSAMSVTGGSNEEE